MLGVLDMNYAIKSDWNIFKTKFSDNPQSSFEWFCYLLFCEEFNKPMGIFRYKNQSGIETNPIVIENETIGWQAKFYDTTLSDHKSELIGTINKSKRDYPTINKILIYSNQEWGQGVNSNDPQAKVDVEQVAKDCGIEIEWRTASFFESPFVTITNKNLAQHFFSLERSIISVLEEKCVHTESILYEIHTNIEYKEQIIEIDRSAELKSIQEQLNTGKVTIVSGVGGVGKTAIIKHLYESLKGKAPFYIFKATEFNLGNINDLFSNFYMTDFIQAHKDEDSKIVVIDSAEKLLDLDNSDPFKEFLAALIKSDWSIIFTTRNNYLEDLNFQFIEIYKMSPLNFGIQILTHEELESLSQKYNFSLNEDIKLIELIRNPFYLNEYLKIFISGENLDYVTFKERLWNKIIRKTKPIREQCFLQIAFQKANTAQFFVNSAYDYSVLNELVKDGVLGYETPGYFITHDIYEEWALEKLIDSEFHKKQNSSEFFLSIGESLPIRRSLRNWISEKLLLNSETVKPFIEEIIPDEKVESFWKDEILVSILLSEYSESFFKLFRAKLLGSDYELIKKIAFLLRIACKEVDNDLLKSLGVKKGHSLSLEFLLTKPKGAGWKSLIKFAYDNLKTIGIENIGFILPVVHDWNSKYKQGETSKFSSLIALEYYQWTIKERVLFSSGDEILEKLFQTILYGASEIKEELIEIFNQVLMNNWKQHRDPYCDLIKVILEKLGDNAEVVRVLPEYVLKLAELYWVKSSSKEDHYLYSESGIEKYFCIENNYLSYYPPSAYQTPIYWLLQSSMNETIDFIISFTNKAVECFATSEFAKHEVAEIEVYIKDGIINKQYICNRLWNVYRGTQTAPHLLEAIHMALEKFILERVEGTKREVLEYWLLYLLEKTKSASISAIVVSIVLAYPEKTFNIAKVLFQTKEFFLYDISRMLLERDVKSLMSLGAGLDYKNKIYLDERLRSCDEKHRSSCLENLAFNYQFFRDEGTSEEESIERQKVIWDIFDKYYVKLPNKSEETEADKTWQLCLARMDRRKMKPTTEEKDGQLLITFNPEIEPELMKFSEKSQEDSSEKMKYIPLHLWAKFKMKNDVKCKEYKQYDESPGEVIKQVKEIIKGLQTTELREFHLFNKSIPGEACAALIRDYSDKLSSEERSFCKDIILDFASSSFRDGYSYQISDGVESAIYVLPLLLNQFPDEKAKIKTILLTTLFDDNNIGMYCRFAEYSIKTIISNLWRINFDEAHSLLLGYLLLKPKYEECRVKLRKENKKGYYNIHEAQVARKFIDENANDLNKVIDNKIMLDDLREIEKMDLYSLRTAFELIPFNTDSAEHKILIRKIIIVFSKGLVAAKREERIDYSVKQDFLEKMTYIVLSAPEEDVQSYLEIFIDKFNNSEIYVDLFKKFISTEDSLADYDKFWYIWKLFFDKVVEICNKGDEYWYTKDIVKSYLFALTLWREDIKEWHTLKGAEKLFFKEIVEKLGHCTSVLYSIAKLLNGIGSIYANDGITWLSTIINVNRNLWTDKIDLDTIYYLDSFIRKFIYINREGIRKTRKLKQEVLIILEFLIQKGSVIGYILRESIL
jgi:hypothetical protein